MATLDNPIVALLPSKDSPYPWLSTPQVAQKLAASGEAIKHVKTVQRRLEKLEQIGLVLCKKEGNTLYWQRRSGATGLSSTGIMSFDEALALQILRKFSTHQLPEHVCSWLSELFHTADSRLAHCISKEEQRYASWSKKVSIISGHFQLQTPPINNEIFHTILNALFRERIIQINYTRLDSKLAAPRTLIPLGLVENGNGVIYLLARSKSSATDFHPHINRYRLDRMSHASMTDDIFQYPDNFNLDSFIKNERGMEFFPQGQACISLRTDRDSARFLQESPLSQDQSIEHLPDGKVIIHASVVLSQRFREWLLARSAYLEVIAPDSLRHSIRDELATALQQHR
ncbi:helix-turn-helix transcriptional regulator [Kerstersia similis]|uniref:helix-turn-helix transcriptional regulator n=1 Tax=Kerstersia similis TaxID=206505 RepID=UPI0039F10A69